MKIYIQILGTATGDTTPSLYINVETNKGSKRYLFNCGEGTQRFCVQHPVKLSKFDHFFFTKLDWEHIGGLPGSILTLYDARVRKISLIGPRNTAKFLECTRYFVSRPDLAFTVKESSGNFTGEVFEDTHGTTYMFALRAEDQTEMEVCQESVQDDQLAQQLRVNSAVDKQNNGSYNIKLGPATTKKRKFSESGEEDKVTGESGFKGAQFEPITFYERSTVDKCDHGGSSSDDASKNVAKDRVKPLFKHLKQESVYNDTMCYAFHAPTIPGKFDPVKAKSLGVTSPLDFGKLSRGESVKVESTGLIVKSEDVISPSKPGPVIIIIECPTESHLNSLVSGLQTNDNVNDNNNNKQKSLSDYVDGSGKDSSLVSVVVHMTPQHILKSPRYQSWCHSFNKNVEHIFINEDVCAKPMVFTSWCINQTKLNHLNNSIFPEPFSNEIPEQKLPDSLIPNNNNNKYHPAVPLLLYNVAPKQGFDYDGILKPIDKDDIIKTTFTKEIEEARMKFLHDTNTITTSSSNESDNHPSLPHIVFLGTVAAVPSKYRNVTSNFINIPGFGCIFFDSGEGTVGQLYRRYGPQQTDLYLLNTKIVFISHIHADHHLGLIRIITRRQKLLRSKLGEGVDDVPSKLMIIGPTYIKYWLEEYNYCEELDYTFIDCYDTIPNKDNSNNEVTKSINQYALKELGLTRVDSVPVVHCPDAFGMLIAHQEGWKILYSGDTRPCAELVVIGENCDLVIHEATFEDELQSEAVDKYHATTSEAIISSNKMNAKFLMLNHFSSRYPKIPCYDETQSPNVCAAFDLMSITFNHYPILPKLLPILRLLMVEENDDNDEDNNEKQKQQQKNERKSQARKSQGKSSTSTTPSTNKKQKKN
eukprot:TRINITY_DN5659_c0_g1_i1.p1 TRINITY_DN5659_c0_g1~~TRINITY_DN5659_c0_g1_i1.p1  ORF type:complete len:871 (-),score=205.67 TRINITY_DN5659_c0_g1_i1:247-2859(-)